MIITPPTNLRRYLETRRDQLTAIIDKSEDARAKVALYSTDDNQRLLQKWLRYIDDDASHWAHSSSHFSEYRFEKMELRWLRDNIDSALTHGPTLLHYIPTAAEAGRPLDDSEKAFFATLHRASEGAMEYGFEPGTPETEDDPDYQGAMALAGSLTSLHALMDEALSIKADAAARIGTLVHLRNRLDPHKWRPAHEPVETLWHASLYAGEIDRTGFLREKPKTRKGMGNFGSQATISLTAERDIAVSIADCLTDAWDIAHGLLTPADILTRIGEEKLEINFQSHFGNVDLNALTTPLDAMKLFRLYLAFTTTRENPVFVNPEELLEALSSTNRDDIGIVACETRIDDAAEFLVGEAEFRVSVDHIVETRMDRSYQRVAAPITTRQTTYEDVATAQAGVAAV